MFGRSKTKTETETPAAPRVRISLEEEARLNLKSAEGELAAASGRLQAFVEANFRMVSGGLVYISSKFNRDELDGELHALTVAVDEARTKFHAALAAWSKFKEDGTKMTSTRPRCPKCGSACTIPWQTGLRCQQCARTFDWPTIFDPQVVRRSGEPPPDTRPSCPACNTQTLVVRLPNGWRCNACGAQF